MGKTLDDRLSHPYIEGVNAFINFARVVVDFLRSRGGPKEHS